MISQPGLDPDVLVLEDADIDGNEEGIKAVLEDTFLPQTAIILKRELQATCLLMLKSLLPLSTKALTLCSLTLLCFTLPLWGQKNSKILIECAVYDN